MVKSEVINQWRLSKGLPADNFGTEVVPFIDAVKYIFAVQKNELNNPALRPE
jgi:hypothetical protein